MNIETIMAEDLLPSEIRIMKIQKAIRKLGYQWQERIYNDGSANDCYIIFSKDRSCTYFSDNILGDLGWGRFRRYVAWEMAFNELVLNNGGV